jgi:hypothetical protein
LSWLKVGVIRFDEQAVPTGLTYEWPYQIERPGINHPNPFEHRCVDTGEYVWCMYTEAPASGTSGPVWFPSFGTGSVITTPVMPTAVYFVVAASGVLPVNERVDNVRLRNGDRFLHTTTGATTIREWNATSGTSSVVITVGANMFVLVEVGGSTRGGSGWYNGVWFQALVAGVVHNVGSTTVSIRSTQNIATVCDPSCVGLENTTGTDHVFVILAARSDGMYPVGPRNAISNIDSTPMGWNWTCNGSHVCDTRRINSPPILRH